MKLVIIEYYIEIVEESHKLSDFESVFNFVYSDWACSTSTSGKSQFIRYEFDQI